MNDKKQRVRKRRIFINIMVPALVLLAGLIILFIANRYNSNRSVLFRTEGSGVQICRNRKWQDFTLNGVNIGYGREKGSKDEYGRLIKQLAARDINVICVNSVFPPDFYQALFEYNLLTSRPLYLFQGICLGAETPGEHRNAFDDDLMSGFLDELRLTIDAVHGKGSGNYNLDNAPYVIGYNFFCDDSGMAAVTNEGNTDILGFEGDYLYTENASPYEAWLAAMGNFAIAYEQERYGGPYRLVSWISWTELPQDLLAVNIGHISSTERYNAGIFTVRHLRESSVNFEAL